MIDYHINIFYSEEDEGYIADIPDLDSLGMPPILKELVSKSMTMDKIIAALISKPVPPPRYRPAIYLAAS